MLLSIYLCSGSKTRDVFYLFICVKEVRLEMCFYIGEEHQASVPEPTNPDVFIQNAERTIYTRSILIPSLILIHGAHSYSPILIQTHPWGSFLLLNTHPYSSMGLIHTHQYSSILINGAHSYSLYSSILIHTRPTTSIRIHTHPCNKYRITIYL